VKLSLPFQLARGLQCRRLVHYTPAANWNGSDSFTYQTSDGTASSNVATVTITVNLSSILSRLTYTAGTGGTLTGERSSQIVNQGEDGTAVTAVPDTATTS